MRTRTCIDQDWLFFKGDAPTAINPGFDDSGWRRLDLPHDFMIEETPHPDVPAQSKSGHYPGGLGWYRKTLNLPHDLGDQRVLIEFDGIYCNSEVWCNGKLCGARPYGYSSFCYDITPYLSADGPNILAVRADNSRQPGSRWYTGSGIYRHVWMTIAQPVRVGHWGTFVTTPRVSDDQATVDCAVTLVNSTADDAPVQVTASIHNTPQARPTAAAVTVPAAPDGSGAAEAHLSLTLPDPELWSPDEPNLYTLRIDVQQDGQTIDTYDTVFGVRSLRFDADEGFFLNGENIKMKGVNEHHDAGCLGAAVPDDVIRYRLGILKKMGCNAIRVAHNPASPTLLDLCDAYGFMVVEDAFDEWREGKTPFGYQLHWDQWWERDLSDMIRRDRNHPCVVMWSVGNEIIEVRQGRPDGLPVMKALQEVCHRQDPTRPMTCGCCNSRETLAAGYQQFMDVFGYNGGGGGCFDYEKDHAAHPDMIMFASEVPHSLQTRGVYRTQTWYRDLARNPNVERQDVPHYTDQEVFPHFDEHYQSSYDNAMVRISSIDSWRNTSRLPFMCGEFRWTGFDYIGECYRWPAKSWNFGIIDLCGFPKDTYYFYQSVWTDAADHPMVHLLPHWTWPSEKLADHTIPVMAYSNCDEIELFLNGRSLGRQTYNADAMVNRWDVGYEPGELKAIGYRGGQQVATCVHHTAGEPAALELDAQRPTIRADGTGVCHVAVRVVDGQGHLNPHAGPMISYQVSGPGRLVGLENGDPIDHSNYQLDHRRAFHGLMAAVIQSTGEPGQITVTAAADGFPEASCSIESVTS